MYRLSCAQIQFLAIDNTHTKYLRGNDKKVWNNYKEAYEAQSKLDNFMSGLSMPNDLDLKEGEEYEIPIRKGKGKGKGK